jgi:2-polyprenyl-3-methyl-5-hydroxy-6-metoxy-1,4-benzoquinol methylase
MSYRQRIYAHYTDAATTPLAPADLAGLAPRRAYLRRLVDRHFPPSREAAIFEIGCGHGALVHVAREMGYRAMRGVDGSPAQVAAARRLGIDGVEAGEALAGLNALAPASQDCIVAFDVIEHLTKDELIAVTDGVARALKPGGRWIVHVPNGASPFAGIVRYGDLTHELAFTEESLSQLMLSSGFASVAFFEDAPVAHGIKSAVRAALWKLVRLVLKAMIVVEAGAAPRVLTQNILAVAIR